jgi:hypothetical protein
MSETLTRRSFLMGVAAMAVAPALPKSDVVVGWDLGSSDKTVVGTFASNTWHSATQEEILADIQQLIAFAREQEVLVKRMALETPRWELYASPEAYAAITGRYRSCERVLGIDPPLNVDRDRSVVDIDGVPLLAEVVPSRDD